MKAYRFAQALIFCSVIMTSGCGSSPKPAFYTLSPVSERRVESPAKSVTALPTIRVKLPVVVDRPQFVIKSGGSRVEILEMQRWGEPLKSSIARVLSENISRLTGIERVATNDFTAKGAFTAITVDFVRFEATTSTVTLDALWTLSQTSGESQRSGRSVRSAEIRGGGYEDTVAAYDQALAAVSGDIAAALASSPGEAAR